jgi:hypothetical protein
VGCVLKVGESFKGYGLTLCSVLIPLSCSLGVVLTIYLIGGGLITPLAPLRLLALGGCKGRAGKVFY